MMKYTTIHGMEYDQDKVWLINPPEGRKDNSGYSAPFPLWWNLFDLNGCGYIIGESKIQSQWISKKLQKEYNTDNILSVDVINSDIKLDITKENLPNKVDFIFCMAVLEHVVDPGSAIRNMASALNPGGLLCISVPNNGFKQHRRPIDCYRFLED